MATLRLAVELIQTILDNDARCVVFGQLGDALDALDHLELCRQRMVLLVDKAITSGKLSSEHIDALKQLNLGRKRRNEYHIAALAWRSVHLTHLWHSKAELATIMSLRKSYFAAGLDALVRDTALPGMKTKEKWTIQDQDDIKASNERFRKLEKSTQAKRTALIKDAMAQVSVQQAYVVAEAFVKAIEGAARVLEEVQETARPKAETPAIGKSAPKSVVKAPSITGIQKQGTSPATTRKSISLDKAGTKIDAMEVDEALAKEPLPAVVGPEKATQPISLPAPSIPTTIASPIATSSRTRVEDFDGAIPLHRQLADRSAIRSQEVAPASNEESRKRKAVDLPGEPIDSKSPPPKKGRAKPKPAQPGMPAIVYGYKPLISPPRPPAAGPSPSKSVARPPATIASFAAPASTIGAAPPSPPRSPPRQVDTPPPSPPRQLAPPALPAIIVEPATSSAENPPSSSGTAIHTSQEKSDDSKSASKVVTEVEEVRTTTTTVTSTPKEPIVLAPTSQETLDRAIFEGHSVEAQDTRRSRVKEKTPAIERQDEMDIDVRVEIEKVTSVVERAISPEPEKELMQMPERHARQEQEREATPVIIFPAKQVDAPSMFPPELQPLARLQKRTVTPSRRLHREISYGAPSGELLERLSASSSHSFSSQRGPTAKGIVEDSLIETVQYRLNHPQIDPLTGEFLNPAAILYTRTTPPLVVTPPETDEDTDDQPVERRRIAKPSEQVSYTSIETDVLLPHASHPDIMSRLLKANINRKIRQDVEEVDEAAQAFRAKYAEIGVMLPEKEHRPWPTFEDYDFDDDRPPMLKRAVSAQRSEETDEEDTSDEEEDVDAGAAVLAQTIAEELHDMSGSIEVDNSVTLFKRADSMGAASSSDEEVAIQLTKPPLPHLVSAQRFRSSPLTPPVPLFAFPAPQQAMRNIPTSSASTAQPASSNGVANEVPSARQRGRHRTGSDVSLSSVLEEEAQRQREASVNGFLQTERADAWMFE